MSESERSWVYHPLHPAKIVDNYEDYREHLTNGWYDTPAKFPPKVDQEIGINASSFTNERKILSPRRGRPPKSSEVI